MIAPPTRAAAATRSVPVLATGSNGGDADSTAALSLLDARLAALAARAPTPEDEALERQREEFDFIARVRAEQERESDALRDLAMEQVKNDNEILKKWIELI